MVLGSVEGFNIVEMTKRRAARKHIGDAISALIDEQLLDLLTGLARYCLMGWKTHKVKDNPRKLEGGNITCR